MRIFDSFGVDLFVGMIVGWIFKYFFKEGEYCIVY